MTLEYIRDAYRVPADIGRAVICNGNPGVIVGANGPHISVNLDKDKSGFRTYWHPTDGIEYGAMRGIRRMTRSQERYQRFLDVGDCYESFAHFLRATARKEHQA